MRSVAREDRTTESHLHASLTATDGLFTSEAGATSMLFARRTRARAAAWTQVEDNVSQISWNLQLCTTTASTNITNISQHHL